MLFLEPIYSPRHGTAPRGCIAADSASRRKRSIVGVLLGLSMVAALRSAFSLGGERAGRATLTLP